MTTTTVTTTTVNRTDFQDVLKFHGHECPGAALGTRIAEVAVSRLGRHSNDNPLVVVSETDSCAIDAVQVLTGCTYGKRNLLHQDNGKNAFTFWRRSDGVGVRLRARPGSVAFRDEHTWELSEKIEAGTATADEAAEFAGTQRARIDRILAAPVDEVLEIDYLTAKADTPSVRRLAPAEACVRCGDLTSVDTLHNHRGDMVCPPCHLAAHGGVMPADHGHGHGQGHNHGDHSHPRAHAHTHR